MLKECVKISKLQFCSYFHNTFGYKKPQTLNVQIYIVGKNAEVLSAMGLQAWLHFCGFSLHRNKTFPLFPFLQEISKDF